MRILLLAAAGLLAATGAAPAHAAKVGPIEVDHPWARPARSGNGAAYLTLRNEGPAPDRLLRVGGDVARSVELHSTAMDARGVMRMRPMEAVDIPAGGAARLAPGGYHVMLVGLRRPLAAGESFPLTLTFEKAGEVTVDVAVGKGPGGGGAARDGDGAMKMDR